MGDIGIQIRKIRKQLNVTQQQLANKLGVTQSAIGMWERGDREPKFETINDIANALGVSIYDICSAEELKTGINKEIQATVTQQVNVAIDKSNQIYDAMLKKMVSNYNTLNYYGKKALLERSEELVQLPKYTEGK